MSTISMIPTTSPIAHQQNNLDDLQHPEMEDLVTAQLAPTLLLTPSRPQIALPWMLTRHLRSQIPRP